MGYTPRLTGLKIACYNATTFAGLAGWNLPTKGRVSTLTLSPMLINGLLIGGMVIVLLLIVGVLRALGSSNKAIAPGPIWADPEGIDLEERLQKISLAATSMGDAALATGPNPPGFESGRGVAAVSTVGSLHDDISGRTARPSDAARNGQSLRPTVPSSAATTRLALPGGGTVRPSEPMQPPMANPGQGLNPLAARFRSVDLPDADSSAALPPGTARRPELPGGVGGGGGGFQRPADAGLPKLPSSVGFIEMPSIEKR